MSIKAVIFDLDGTLLDTERLFSELLVKAAADNGWDLDMDTVIDCIGTTEAETERIVRKDMGKDFPYEHIRSRGVDLFRHHVENNGIPFKSGAERLMDCLESRGLPFGLATTSVRKEVNEILDFAGIRNRFATIVCGDEVVNGKPDPEIYLKAAANMGISPDESLVFEDSLNGIQAAAAAGARVVWIPDIQNLPDSARTRCFSEIGSLEAVCDRLGELVG